MYFFTITKKKKVFHYEGFGKEFAKFHKTSPDSIAQLVKQLAFHRMFGRPGVTYESAQTRKFQLGRTEVIRSASNESKAWAEAMLDPHQQVRPSSFLKKSRIETHTNLFFFFKDIKHLRKLFDEAAHRHGQYATWATNGEGVDRHLFGLKKMLKEGEPIPEIFTDPAFGQSSHWELSTSQLSSRYLNGWGYGEGEFRNMYNIFAFPAPFCSLSYHSTTHTEKLLFFFLHSGT